MDVSGIKCIRVPHQKYAIPQMTKDEKAIMPVFMDIQEKEGKVPWRSIGHSKKSGDEVKAILDGLCAKGIMSKEGDFYKLEPISKFRAEGKIVVEYHA